jgi:hypothetical protein
MEKPVNHGAPVKEIWPSGGRQHQDTSLSVSFSGRRCCPFPVVDTGAPSAAFGLAKDARFWRPRSDSRFHE